MKISLLQLNIEEGRFKERIYEYVRKYDFDILHLQEVTSGEHNKRGIENFSDIKQSLDYEGIQSVYWRLKDDPNSYMSNAIFYKKSLPFESYREVFLKPYAELTREEMADYPSHPTSLLDAVFSFSGKKVHCITTHLVWGPTPVDEQYKLEQGKILYEYIKQLDEQFVLSGDFNVTPDSQIVAWIDELGINHVKREHITNTLNPNTHRAHQLFPKGLAVDFLYTHPSLQISNFRLVDSPDLSDHFGLAIDLYV